MGVVIVSFPHVPLEVERTRQNLVLLKEQELKGRFW